MSICLLLWLCIAAVNDAIQRKCFNWVVLVGLSVGLTSVIFNPQGHPVEITLVDSLLGIVFGFFVTLIFYKLKIMGAGDVKFAAALGAWVGWQLLLPIWALSCLFSLVHGFCATKICRRGIFELGEFPVVKKEKKLKFIPYVTYLSMSAVFVLVVNK